MVVRAIEKRLSVGLSAQSGWSLAHMAHVWARLGRGRDARRCLDLLRCFVMNNLFTVHNDWRNMGVGMVLPPAPFQIDANMGYASAVHEMLLQSDAGEIELFPALPEQWTRGRLGALLAAGGIRVELSWDEKSGQAALCSPVETRVRVSAFGVPQGEFNPVRRTAAYPALFPVGRADSHMLPPVGRADCHMLPPGLATNSGTINSSSRILRFNPSACVAGTSPFMGGTMRLS